MTPFAPIELTGRRPDQPGVALLLDRSDMEVDADKPFADRAGRRYQSGSLVRLGVIFTPLEDVNDAEFAIRFGNVEGRLVYEGGLWHVLTDDAEDGKVPVAASHLLAGVSYAVSLCIDFGSYLYRDVIVEGHRVGPQVVDLVPGPPPVEVFYTVDVLTGGEVDPNMPEWAKAAIAELDASQLLELARQHGGRFEVSHIPEQEFEEVLRLAPLVQLDGEQSPIFTFSVESSTPLTVARLFAHEA